MAQILLKIFAFVVISAQLTLSEEFTCPRSRGYYPHPVECNKYYSCRKRISTLKVCPERMLFDIEKGNCYVDSAVDCGERKKPTVVVVTMEEIRTETSNKLSTTHSILSTIDDNNITSDALRTASTEVGERNNTATNEANVSDEMLTTLSDNEASSKENTLDGTISTIFQTSGVTTDAVDESLDNNVTEDHDLKTYPPFVSINEVTDEDVTAITKLDNATVVPTEIDLTTNEKPGTGVAELNDSIATDLFTSKTDNSSTDITTLEYINSNTTIVPNEIDLTTNEKPGTEETELDYSIVTDLFTNSSTDITTLEYINSNKTETFEANTTTIIPYQTKSTYEDLVYTENSLQNTSMDSNETTIKEDKEPSITDLINTNLTTYMPAVTTDERDDQNNTVVTEFDEVSTKISSETELTHDEIVTTVTEYFDPITTQSNITSDSIFVSDGEGKNNTTSDGAVDSTTQVTQNINFETTDRNAIVTEDQYPDDYLDDLECPTAYGRYPHPTDKHKFFHCQEWFPHVMVCPANLIFDPQLETCVWSLKYW